MNDTCHICGESDNLVPVTIKDYSVNSPKQRTNSIESEAFMRDNVVNAAESMIKIFEHLGYSKLA